MFKKIFLVTSLVIFSLALSVSAAGRDFGDNPIDKYYFEALCYSSSTVAERLIASDYIRAWEAEVLHAAGFDASEEMAKLEQKASKIMDEEVKKWNGGTGGPGAGMIAYGQVYRDRAQELIHKNRSDYIFFAHASNASYMPLVQALANSQVVHYDAFNLRPDAQTANLMMYNTITAWSLPIFRGKKAPAKGEAYALRLAMEDLKKPLPPDNIKPDNLYGDIFAAGTYIYPEAKDCQQIIVGTPTGIIVTPQNLPYTGELWILGGTKKGDAISLRVLLTRLKSGRYGESVGLATIVLRQDAKHSSGYSIVAYHPEYERFGDVDLFR